MPDPTPLTPEARLRTFASASPEDAADMVTYESDLIAADIRELLATLAADAVALAAPAPDDAAPKPKRRRCRDYGETFEESDL